MEPTLQQVTDCLDRNPLTNLLTARQHLIQRLIDGTSIRLPAHPDLQLSSILVDFGVIIAYLTGKSVIMFTHCEYWARQGNAMLKRKRQLLCQAFGVKNVNMCIKVPVEDNDEVVSSIANVVLVHGLKFLNFPEDQTVGHQDLGSKWDGIIRPNMERRNEDASYCC